MKMLKHLFGKRDKELDVLQEEALQSPLRTVVRNFTFVWRLDRIFSYLFDRFNRTNF